MKKILFLLPIIGLLLLLFTRPDVIASGCSLGLTLWYTAVLPSLLPFMILSGLLIRTGLFRYLNSVYAPFLGRLFSISDEGCYAVLLGFLCGFPMGAKVIADLVQEGRISPEEGSYLLGFCNNVSPAFFLNYVCLQKLGYSSVPWKLVFLFYAIAVCHSLSLRPFYPALLPLCLPSRNEKTGTAAPAGFSDAGCLYDGRIFHHYPSGRIYYALYNPGAVLKTAAAVRTCPCPSMRAFRDQQRRGSAQRPFPAAPAPKRSCMYLHCSRRLLHLRSDAECSCRYTALHPHLAERKSHHCFPCVSSGVSSWGGASSSRLLVITA